jgi:hypothetical protein
MISIIPYRFRILIYIFMGITFMAFIGAMSYALPAPLGIDWRLTYRPAALALWRGDNPYNPAIAPEAPFFAAPWALLPLLPLTLLPVEIGRVVVMVGGMLVFAYTAWRLGANPLTLAAFLLSPPVMHCVVNANIEWLPLLGFVLPPAAGLFFVAIKPQTGLAVAIFWLIEGWRNGGWRRVVKIFAPVTVAFLVSFLLYGLWPLRMTQVLGYAASFNSSLWPGAVPVGLALIATALQKRAIKYAIAASPCLSPYVLLHTWSSTMLSLVGQPLQLVIVVVGWWVVLAISMLA